MRTPPTLLADSTADRRLSRWTLAACAALLAAMALPMLFGRVYVADDLGEFHLPIRAFYAQQLARGEPFDWMPSLFCGFYLSGEGQLGGYHPWHWLLYRWLPLGLAFDLEILVSYPLLLAGMYLLLRRHVPLASAALLGAMAFTFSGFCLLHFVHVNAIAVIAHLPWLLWACDMALASSDRRQTARAELVFAVLLASQLLLGYPQYVWFSLLAIVAYAAWRCVQWRPGWRAAARLGAAALCAALIGAAQLIPTADLLANSTRRTVDAEFVQNGSLHPLNLVQLVAPYLFQTRVVGQTTHELGLYAGAVPLVLCVLVACRWRSLGPLRPLAMAAAVLAAVAMLLAMGPMGGIYRLQQWLPAVNRFRLPCRAIVLLHLATSIGAAGGWCCLALPAGSRPNCRLPPSAFRLGLTLLFATSVAIALVAPLLWPDHVARWPLVWAGPMLIATAAFLAYHAATGRRWALVGLVLLAVVDQGAYGLSYAVYPHTATLERFAAEAERSPDVQGRVVAGPLASGSAAPRVGNRMLLSGVRRADGYAGLEPARSSGCDDLTALRAAGVRWVLPAAGATVPAGLTPRGTRWLQVPQPLPRARLVAAAGAPVASIDSPFDAPGSARLVLDRPGQLEIATAAPTQQWLIVAESFHSGWQADVDGQPVPVVRVERDFLGCEAPAGMHRVGLRFRPRSLSVGQALSSCGLGLLLCLFVTAIARRAPAGDPP